MQCWPLSGCTLAVALVGLFTGAFSVDCPTPVHPRNGRAEWQGLSPGDKVTYTCNFASSGQSVATCQNNGEWSSAPPVCFMEGCPPLPPVSNSLNQAAQQGDFMYVFYHCFSGYRLVGHYYRICMGTGWSNFPPVCVEIPKLECSDPVAPADGSRTYSSLSVGSLVRYQCNAGYRLVGEQVRTCEDQQGKAVWSSPPPECEVLLCPVLVAPTNGGLTVASQGIGSLATYSCKDGYQMVEGSASRTCEEEVTEQGVTQAAWSGSAPKCELQCPEPLATGNGQYIISSYGVGGRATFHCDGNYTLQGGGMLLCILTGSGRAMWSGSLPFCKLLECPALVAPTNGGLTVASQSIGSLATYSCKDGYQMVEGSASRTCEEEVPEQGVTQAAWSGSAPKCELQCPEPLATGNGQYIISSYGVGGRATFHCDGNYTLQGGGVLLCILTGSGRAMWSGSLPFCKLLECSDPGKPVNGDYSLESLKAGSKVTYHCSYGYYVDGDMERVCQEGANKSAIWSGDRPHCTRLVCPDPGKPAHGGHTISSSYLGGKVTYYCDGSYQRVGDKARVCGQDQAGEAAWNGSLPTCEPILCGDPGTPANGDHNVTSSQLGGSVKYLCNSGYQLVGEEGLFCQQDAQRIAVWSGGVPTCESIQVFFQPVSYTVAEGKSAAVSLAVSSIDYDLSITVNLSYIDLTATRNVDYSPSPTSVVFNPAQATATFHIETFAADAVQEYHELFDVTILGVSAPFVVGGEDTAHFIITDDNDVVTTGQEDSECVDPGDVVNAKRDFIDTAVDKTVVEYSCDDGYELVGSARLQCLMSGEWSHPLPTCQPVKVVTCSFITSPLNGQVVYSDLSLRPGSMANFSCNSAYDMIGLSMLVCLETGQWDQPIPECYPANITTCPHLVHPSNGSVTYDNPSRAVEAVATFDCESGFMLEGFLWSTCLPSGQWDRPSPACAQVVAVACPIIPSPVNGQVIYSQVALEPNTTASFSCQLGYNLDGFAVLNCRDDGQWDNPVPTCRAVLDRCPQLEEVANAVVSVLGNGGPGTVVSYVCNAGYMLEGAADVRCMQNGEWDNPEPTCAPVTCPFPGFIENGMPSSSADAEFLVGSNVTYSCNSSTFDLRGSQTLTCLPNGQWNQPTPMCLEITCPFPGIIENGTSTASQNAQFSINATVNFSCNVGYRLEGAAVLTCMDTQEWSHEVPTCLEVTCAPLTAPSNGEVSLSDSSFGDTANFSCETGYELIGSASLRCEGSGEWSDTVPTCQIVDCGDPGTSENSRRTLLQTTFGGVVTYECEVGHRQEGLPFRICQANKLWSNSVPTCTVVDCGDPGNPQNGRRILQGGTEYQNNVTYECDTGFSLEGDAFRTCQALATWSGSQPSCNRVTCTPLAAPFNGEVSLSDSSFGDTANFSCDTGYELIGSASLRCEGSGEWSDTVPTCQIIDCGDPGTPENGRRSLSNTTFGSVVNYECEIGYTQEGASSRVCQENKLWTNSVPNCSLVDCGDPGNPQNGRRILQGGTKYQSNVTYECDTGFSLEGVAFRTCLALGNWSGSQPSCNLIDCGDPGAPQNGSRSLQGTKYEDTVKYLCDNGFELNGPEMRTCQMDGTWTGSLPACQAVDCGDPGTPSNGGRSLSSTLFDATVHYSCDEGYQLSGSSSRICQSNMQWSQTLPECRPVSCGDPGTPQNGRRTLTATTFTSNVTYECSEGYLLEGPQIRQCLSNGQWSNTLPQCVLIECPDPGTPDNGRRELSTRTMGSLVVYECNDGYNLSGERVQQCLSNGTWSHQLPSCELVDCGDPGLVENSERNLTASTYGSTATYSCSSGFMLTSLGFRTCQLNGLWSGTLPQCQVVFCGDPGIPANGFRNISSTIFGSTVEYSCFMGYELQGTISRTCEADGRWSDSVPTCQLASCPDPGISPNSQRQLFDLKVGSYITYSCLPGYRLVGVASILCLISEEWTSLPPQCVLISCGDPGTPVNGIRVGDNFTFGSVVQFRCNDSYELSGNERRECLQDGRWSGFTPTCVIGGCGDPGTPTNGLRDLTGTSVASVVSYRCEEGYRIRGIQFRGCQTNGIWSGRLPSCELVDCGDPGFLQNGGRNFSSGTVFGSVVTYTCAVDFLLTGTQNRTCQSSGRWSGAVPECSPSGCGDPGSLDNGRVEFTDEFKILSMATYSCSTGYRLSGLSVRVCLSGGQWSSGQPSCELVDCGDPGVPRNGNRNLTGTTFDSSVQYSCRSGYQLSGSSIRICEATGRWSNSVPVCNPIDCGDPGNVEMGVRELLVGTTLGSTTIFKCNPGYQLEGSATRKCQANGLWSGSLPRCVSILCDDPGTPLNGVRSLQNLSVNSIVTYQCNQGYDLEGTSSRVCRVDGQWTGQLPTCTVVDCGDPGLPANSDRDLTGDGTRFNAVVQYFCDEGFRLQGSDQRQCQANGQWSGSLPICIRSDCGDPGLVGNGQRELTGTAVGETVTFSCFEGFTMEGSQLQECQQSGLWSGSLPTCTLIDCGDPGTPSDGRRSISGTTFGSEVSYTCNDGFVLNGPVSRECNISGWSGSLPSCNRVDCGDPGILTNGGRALGATTFNSRVAYFCDPGYVLNGNSDRVCQANGNWTGSHPRCIVVMCGDPGTPSNGQRELSDQNFGTEVTYTCDVGYELEGSRQRTCQASGRWSGQLPECRIVDCGNPGSPQNGQVEVAGTSFRAVATCSCDVGYELVGEASRVCGSDGEWSSVVPSCSPVNCGDPGGMANGDVLILGTTLNSVAQYSCRSGYFLVGVRMRTCQTTGRWSGSLPRCDPIDCGDPGTPVNGNLQLADGTKLNSVVRYSCFIGYVLAGAKERICQADGTWSSSLPSCGAVDCGDPGTPSHGSREPDPVLTELSHAVRYSCDEGYELLGSQLRTCQVNGQWSGELPTCQIVNCGDPGSPNNGIHIVFSTTFGSRAHYECDSRFQLEGQDERICQASGQWSGSLPSCVLIDCGPPEEPENGRAVLSSGTTLGARATYQCTVGFQLSITAARVCLEGEVWSGTVPTCTMVDCGDPGTPFNAVKLGSASTYQSSVVYSCSPGYALLGDFVRTCQATGLWTGALPICELVNCGDPGVSDNGFRVGSNYKFGGEVYYTCDPGFQLSGPQSRTCQSSGSWSGTLPACLLVSCGDPGTPSNGQGELSDQNFGTEVTYTCDVGYELEGSRQRTCQASGRWSGQLPECRIVDCDDPGTSLNGNRQLNLTTFGSVAEYSCNDGYELVGSQRRTCGSTGRWSGSIPVCSPTDCGDPGRPTNGDRVLSDTSLGSQVLYICNPGFEMSGSQRRVCETTSSWSGSLPTCTAIECGDPGVPRNGSRQLSGETAGSVVTYRCDTGFDLVGASTQRCMDSGDWSDLLPECRVVDCRDPGTPHNGLRSLQLTTYQSTVTYTCNPGYMLVGEQSRQCQANSKWSGVLATCSPVDCQDPGTPANGDRMLVSTTFTATVFYSCRLGYKMEGNQHRTCQASGNWSGSLPICNEVDCGEPGEPNQGSVDVQGSGTSAVAVYQCDRGYRLEGDSRRICQASETWTGTVPTCKIVDCFDPGVPNNGLQQLNFTTFGSTVLYSCRQGYRLEGQAQRTCQASGRWSGTLVQCVPSNCGDIGPPQDGRVDFSSTAIGSIASYSCSEGYTLDGTATRICQPSGEWSSSTPECDLVDCLDPGTPANGIKLGFATTYQSVVSYACRTGYAMRGESQRTCQASGDWTGSLPLCELVDCGDPGTPRSGLKAGTNYKFQGRVSFSCNNGFQLSGSQTRTCQASGKWSGSTAECLEVTCGDPGTPLNAQRVLEDTTFDATVRYSCNEGYLLVGESERQCGSDGQWSGPLPRCELVSCGDPGHVLNAVRTSTSFTFGSMVQYQCRDGYRLEGQNELTCLASRLWSHPLPRCSLVDCGDPGRSSNGQRSLAATTAFSTVTYSCNRGYNLLGNKVRTCLQNGSWNGTIPICRVVDCGSPGSPGNGTIKQLTGTTYGFTVSYSCNAGYSLEGAASRVCQDNGQWSKDVPVCRVIDCRDPGTPENGKRQLSSTTFASTVTYSCSAGYTIKGSERRSCQSDGRWSNFLPVCEPISCGDPGSPVNAVRLLSSTTLHSEVQFQCVEGHVIEGDAERTCQADGQWSGTLPRCVPITCPDPGTPVNGQRTIPSLTVGAVVSYRCDEGYSIVGVSTRTCQSSGQWTRELPLCQLLDCGDPGTLTNGMRELNGTTFRSSVTYSCNSGYVIMGESLRNCLSSGFWSSSLPICAPVDCGVPGMPQNGYGVYNLTILDAMVTYSCSRGYDLVGSPSRTCLSGGSWLGSIPECRVVDCGSIESPANGRVSFTTTVLRSTAMYSCDSGYSLRGVSSRECQVSGTWSGTVPACQLVECGDPGQLQDGVRNLAGVTFGSDVTFSCNSNFTLSGPDRRVCQADGFWSDFQPECKRIRCTDPGTPSDGTRELLDTVVGAMVTYSCRKGYQLLGNEMRTCQIDTTWTGSLPICQIMDCGDPGAPSFGGHSSLQSTTFGAVVSFFCQAGYLLRGDSERLCLDNGEWSGTLPTCSAIDCGIPGLPDNGMNSHNATTYPSVVRYTCNANFELVGMDVRQCQLDGTWSGAVPVCRRIPDVDCGDPGRPSNGDSSFSSTVEGSSVTHSCQPGYNLVGDRRRICRADGRWSGSLPECRGIDCGVPDQVVNSNIDFTTTTLGSTAIYTCNPGATLQGNSRRTCQQNGQWSGSPPTCMSSNGNVTQCPDPGLPDNTGRFSSGFHIGGTVTYGCLPGYTLVGSDVLTCLSGGQWSNLPPSCQLTVTTTPTTTQISPSLTTPSVTLPSTTPTSTMLPRCGVPGSPANGSVNFLEQDVGSIASYRCDEGFTLVGVSTRECENNFQWSDSVPICTPSSGCGDPGTPENGRQFVEDFNVGSTVVYLCNTGFSIEGDQTRVCQADFTWMGTLPSCQISPIQPAFCDDPGAPQNGRQILITTESNVTFVYYECFDDFQLDGPSRRICQTDGSFDGSEPRCIPKSSACEGSSIVYDQRGRRCICFNRTFAACSRVRLDFLSLSADDRKRYLDTVKFVSTDSFYKPRYDYIIKKFEDLQDTNVFENNPAISQFLPWLRYYLIEYEDLLKSVDPNITVPFWDWTAAPLTPYNTSYFDNDLGFGNMINSSSLCVTTGPFRESVWQVTPSAGGECLTRELDTSKSFPVAAFINEDILVQPASEFTTFFNLLKFLVYDLVRCFVGGQMCSSDAPNDPMFLLLAARIDAIFDEWQKSGDGRESARYGSDDTTLLGTNLPVSAYNNNLQLPGGMAVEYGLPYHLGRSRRAYRRARSHWRMPTVPCLSEEKLPKLGQIPVKTLMWLRSICPSQQK